MFSGGSKRVRGASWEVVCVRALRVFFNSIHYRKRMCAGTFHQQQHNKSLKP